MTTLAVDKSRALELGDIGEYPVVATDIIYEGAAVGDNGSGYARPLVSGDIFLGFAQRKADNSAGGAGDIYAKTIRKGSASLTVTSVAITDVGRPVYAADDDTFALDGIGSFIGYVRRYVSAGVCIVEFDANVPEKVSYVTIPITNSKIADGDVVTTFTPGFNGRIKGMSYVTHDPVTTGAKASTLNLEIGATNVTGGTLGLASATMTPIGKITASAAITAGAGFKSTDTISIEASATTAFIEGTGSIVIALGG
jgi:hypothetical protein